MFFKEGSVADMSERYNESKAKLKTKFVAKLQKVFSDKEATSMALRDTVIELDKEINMIDGEMKKISDILITENS